MGGICKEPEGQWFVWRYPFSQETQSRFVSDTKPKENVKINYLELSALLEQVHLFAHNMQPLDQIRTAVDNTVTQGWANRGSVSSYTVVGTILQDLNFLTRTHQIYASVRRIVGTDNIMSDASSRLNHLPEQMFLHHLSLTFL